MLVDEVRDWAVGLPDLEKLALSDAIDALEEVGPTLGRPLVDTLAHAPEIPLLQGRGGSAEQERTLDTQNEGRTLMGTNWRDVRAAMRFTPEDEARIAEMHRATMIAVELGRLREHREVTQVGLATALGTTQGNISRIEHQEDLFLSTLRGYVAALGGRLEVRAMFDDEVVEIMPDPGGRGPVRA